ncbi:MAG: hypothetical protein LBL76_04330 [Treponema sp.]|nr:hypothetical protein [Treponema sp.]
MLIIKKKPGVTIEQPIGAIFRTVNLIEYKSPKDHVSIADFHQVGAYARLYSVLNGVDIRDMTISFVAEAYPRELVHYLQEAYRYEVVEERAGIYRVRGDIVGIQLVESKRLDGEAGVWLQGLRSGLNGEGLRAILERGKGMPKGAPLSAYMYVVLQANSPGFKEVLRMSEASFEEVLEEFGLTAKWEAKGWDEAHGEDVRKLQKYGMDPLQIAKALELPLGTVFQYLSTE